MYFDLSKPIDKQKFELKSKNLIKKGSLVELTEKSNRTLKQNAYLHLIISYFALMYGDNLEYCKRKFYKIESNLTTFEYERINKLTGEVRKALKSTKDLSKTELSLTIERFKDYSANIGIVLPDAEQKQFINEIKREVENNKEFI